MENKISACLVIYNEEKVLERCLESIKNLVAEIIVVHDGECTDKSLEIAKKYTDNIFVRPHIGIAEPHRSFTFTKARHNWILQIDADEYFDQADLKNISELIDSNSADGYWFKWEIWNGKKSVYVKGLKKLCFFKKDKIIYQGIPQKAVEILGVSKDVDIFLRHQPTNENFSWRNFNKKRNYWLESHVKYFFPELVSYQCFNTTPDSWIEYTKKVRRHPLNYLIFYPLKNLVGQLKNGLWYTRIGWHIALQQYVYYIDLYYRVWKRKIS